jgi:DNA-binding IclR family transcriptional regulator
VSDDRSVGNNADAGAAPGRGDPGVHVSHRATEILRALRDEGPNGLSLTQIAGHVRLPRSTVHRIIRALEAERLVASAGAGGYHVGTGLAELVRLADGDLVEAIHPFVLELSREVGETTGLATLEHGHTVFVDQVPARHILRAEFPVGTTLPLHCTANGKALLAELPRDVILATLPARLERFTPRTLVARARLLESLERTRSSGVAYDHDEFILGISALSKVVRDPAGRRIAVTVSLPSPRMSDKATRIQDRLREISRRIEDALARAVSASDRHA